MICHLTNIVSNIQSKLSDLNKEYDSTDSLWTESETSDSFHTKSDSTDPLKTK